MTFYSLKVNMEKNNLIKICFDFKKALNFSFFWQFLGLNYNCYELFQSVFKGSLRPAQSDTFSKIMDLFHKNHLNFLV